MKKAVSKRRTRKQKTVSRPQTRKQKAVSKPRIRKQEAEVSALAALPDEKIDTGDIPELRDWSGARRGAFFRPVKRQLTLRLDADLIAWFKEHARGGRGYQTDINRALRDYVERYRRKTG